MPTLYPSIECARVLVRVLTLALAAVTAVSAHADPNPRTLFAYDSEPGDYVGGGESHQYTPQDANFTIHGTPRDFLISVETPTGYWYVELAAPRGERLVPRTYLLAERATFRTGRAPGLSVYGPRGCNELWGEFTVNQIATDESGRVAMLDATFSQRCEEEDAPRLNGVVLYRASPLSFAFESDPGDYLGQGQAKSYANDTSRFRLEPAGTDIEYNVSGNRNDWLFFIGPPLGQTLQPGTYETARAADATHARLDIYTDGRGCNQNSGTLTVEDVGFDGEGNVKRLWATFEQHCENREPALRGTIHHYD